MREMSSAASKDDGKVADEKDDEEDEDEEETPYVEEEANEDVENLSGLECTQRDFEAMDDTMIDMKEGDEMALLGEDEGGWCRAQNIEPASADTSR